MLTSYNAQDGFTTTNYQAQNVSRVQAEKLCPRPQGCLWERRSALGHPGSPALTHVSGRTQGRVEGGKGRVGERQVRVALPAAMLQCEATKPEISKVEPGLPGLCEAIFIKAGG